MAWGLALAVTAALFGSCKRMTDERRLTVGGVHAFDGTGCKLGAVEPAAAVKDLQWEAALVIEAKGEGTLDVVCGGATTRVRLVAPARLSVVLTEDQVVVGKRFHVRAVVHDRDGRELDIGKYTDIAWKSDGVLVGDNDPSAGEFGFCDTCFGMQGFRATAAGTGTIEGALGGVRGSLSVRAP